MDLAQLRLTETDRVEWKRSAQDSEGILEEFAKTLGTNNERALDVTTSLDFLSNLAAARVGADLLIIDVGSSLGALNRAALLACDHVVLPVAPDLFSLQCLRNVGPTLNEWRRDWGMVRERGIAGKPQEQPPPHDFRPLGYLVQQHLARADRSVAGYARWAESIPTDYRRFSSGDSLLNSRALRRR